jgi:hypothetical protein
MWMAWSNRPYASWRELKMAGFGLGEQEGLGLVRGARSRASRPMDVPRLRQTALPPGSTQPRPVQRSPRPPHPCLRCGS